MSPAFAVVLEVAATALLLTLLVGLIRVWRGPRAEDRMLAGQLFGTTGVAILLVLAARNDAPSLRDIALVLAALAIVTVATFVGRVGESPATESVVDEDVHELV
jgi:multicomponent Na+:H+ antiporter subunit F